MLSASECKPCVQPCAAPGTHLSGQPRAAVGSSTSLPPASIAEDIFFHSPSDDEVKLRLACCLGNHVTNPNAVTRIGMCYYTLILKVLLDVWTFKRQRCGTGLLIPAAGLQPESARSAADAACLSPPAYCRKPAPSSVTTTVPAQS